MFPWAIPNDFPWVTTAERNIFGLKTASRMFFRSDAMLGPADEEIIV